MTGSESKLTSMRRTRILAFFLDLLLCAAVSDAVGLAVTAAIWAWAPAWRWTLVWVWGTVAFGGFVAFLLRDASGGRARRWLALEAIDRNGRPPGPWRSIRRNLPLLVPIWNLVEAWPVLRNGQADRPSDRHLEIRIVSTA